MPEHPHVVAVNVGRAAPLAVGGRVVASGIVKHAAVGPVAVGPLGVEGDEQADRVNHGGPYKAVYAYAQGGRGLLGGGARPPASSRPPSART